MFYSDAYSIALENYMMLHMESNRRSQMEKDENSKAVSRLIMDMYILETF